MRELIWTRLNIKLIVPVTRSCPIATSGRSTTKLERPASRVEEAWAEAWTPRTCSPSCSEVEVDSSAEEVEVCQHVQLASGTATDETGRSSGPRRGKDLVHRIGVSLEDLYKGKVQKLALSKSVICTGCEGRGGKKGSVSTCTSCRGQGVKVMLRQLGPMMQQIQQPCNECEGTGEMMNPKDRCKQCNGKKTTSERKVLEVHIDKGMKSGQQIKFAGESDQSPGVIPGDVVIVLEEKPHPRFQRKGDDLYCEAEIDLLTALGGGEFAIEHLDDRALHVTIVPGEIIKPDALKVISHQGMPSYRHHELGDLYVKIHVKFPDTISPEVIPALESALPARNAVQKFSKNIHVDEVTLEEPNDRQKRSAATNGDEMDEDDDERPGVQCAQRESW
jgi:DnaJ family protein A protein 2